MNKWVLGIPIIALLSLPFLSSVSAHGVEISYTATEAIVVEINAAFDTGEPMAEAQVAVYAPNDAAEPWMTGTADEDGLFTFIPDPDIPGTWEVVVRQSGHGDTVYVTIEADETGNTVVNASGTSNPYTPAQMIMMGASVVWGCIGTALYFISRRG